MTRRTWLLVHAKGLVVRREGERVVLPDEDELTALGIDRSAGHRVGPLQGRDAFAVPIEQLPEDQPYETIGLRALAAMFEGGYRASPKTAEEAASILRSSAAAPDERVGAAMALRVAGETDRVRAAAAATAEVRVRVALEAVADAEDDAAIEKALRRMAVR